MSRLDNEQLPTLYTYEDAKSEVLRALLIKITFFIVAPLRFVRSYERLKGACCLHVHGQCSLTSVYKGILCTKNYNKEREKLLYYVQSPIRRPTSVVFIPGQQIAQMPIYKINIASVAAYSIS